MANIQNIADRIFRHVNEGHLQAGYALAMGAIIDADNENSVFHAWVNTVYDSAIEKLIACMVRKGAWDNPTWLLEYLQEMEVSNHDAA